MQWNVPPDLESLIQKRLSTGIYEDADDVLRRALQAQEMDESWTDEERLAVAAHINEGYQQAARGELINPAQVREDVAAMKEDWRASRG